MTRPVFHFTSKRNWINDPNGLIYYKGYYHMFYQHFPYEPMWGTMHWGHCSSKDLVHWNHHPIALYPSKDFDCNGCFSGSAINFKNQLYLYYTAIQYRKTKEDYIHVQESDDDLIASQALMISDDGFTFDNHHQKFKVIDAITDENFGSLQHTRDPKVWLYNDKIYMIIGSKVKNKNGNDYNGVVLFYESEDGHHFKYVNRYSNENIGNMWECPDLFKINDQYFMVFSPEHIDTPPKPVSNAVIMKVDFEEESCQMTSSGDYMYLDYGLDFYAPQSFLDEKNRRVMIGWLRMRLPIAGHEWVGMMSMPRVLKYENGELLQKVHPNIDELFVVRKHTFSYNQPQKIITELNDESIINLGGLVFTIENDCLKLDRRKVSIECENVCNETYSPQLNGQYQLELYYDHHVVEVYINGGKYVMTQVVYELDGTFSTTNVSKMEFYTLASVL